MQVRDDARVLLAPTALRPTSTLCNYQETKRSYVVSAEVDTEHKVEGVTPLRREDTFVESDEDTVYDDESPAALECTKPERPRSTPTFSSFAKPAHLVDSRE
jgi:hypothetical protein